MLCLWKENDYSGKKDVRPALARVEHAKFSLGIPAAFLLLQASAKQPTILEAAPGAILMASAYILSIGECRDNTTNLDLEGVCLVASQIHSILCSVLHYQLAHAFTALFAIAREEDLQKKQMLLGSAGPQFCAHA